MTNEIRIGSMLCIVGLAAGIAGAGCSDDSTDSASGGAPGGMTNAHAGGGSGGTAPSAGAPPASGGKGTAPEGGKASAGGNSSGGSRPGGTTSGGSPGGGRGATGGTTDGGDGGATTNGGSVNGGGGKSSSGGRDAGGEAGADGASGAGGRDLLVPDSGALLGLYYGDESIAETATKLGRAVPLHLTYYAWEDDFTRAETSKDLAAGRVPFVNWELFGGELDDIIAGDYDEMIATRAAATKALAKPLFIDFGAEMNGDWSPWGGAQNGESAEKYLAVYRKVHDAFTAAGAENAIWVFCPNVTDEPRESWNEALDYYPGDAYVDWMCVDGYNWGTTNGGGWQSFEDVFANIYPKLVSKNKPIMIGEMASTEEGGDKAAWIDAMVPTLTTNYPKIRGLIWFDVDKETDWRISSSPESEAAFKRLASDAYFNP